MYSRYAFFFDVQRLQRAIRKQFKQLLGGLDWYNVLDFLKYRLSNSVKSPVFERLPQLPQVIEIFLFRILLTTGNSSFTTLCFLCHLACVEIFGFVVSVFSF